MSSVREASETGILLAQRTRGAPDQRENRKLAYQASLVKDIRRYVAGPKRRGVKFDKAVRRNKDTEVEGSIAFDPFGASAFFKETEGSLLLGWQNIPPM